MEPCNGISFDERPSMIETSPLALSEFQDIRAQTFSKEDFLNTTTPYDLLAHYRHDEFHHSQMLAVMQDKAEQAGVGRQRFKEMYKSYCLRMDKANTPPRHTLVFVDNQTGVTLNLDLGAWEWNDQSGIWRTDGSKPRHACSHPIAPVKRLVNVDTGTEKLQISFQRGGRWRDLIVDKRILASTKSIVQLADNGVAVTSETARDLVTFINDVESNNYDQLPEQACAARLGYIDGMGFAPYVDNLVFDGDANFRDMFHAIRAHGDFEKWLTIARECRQMSVTAHVMLAASFASVLVKPLGLLPFFVNLWSVESGTGKTVALMLAASVWGNPQVGTYIKTFDGTTVGFEKTAAFLNSLPMLIDELQLAKVKKGKFNVYQLAEGVGRTRGTKAGGVEKAATWRNCILTTGETPLTNAGDGAGARNRVIDIECRATDMVIRDGNRVVAQLSQHYGFAGRLFVDVLNNDQVMGNARTIYQDAFEQLSKTDTTEKQAMAAAVILAADAIASTYIFHDQEFLRIPEMAAFLKTKASVSAGERGYRYICSWVAQNINRFCSSNELGDIYGTMDKNYVYIISTVFQKAVESEGYNAAALLSYLKHHGLILTRPGRNTRGKRINGVNTECVVLLLERPEPEQTPPPPEPMPDDFEEI